MNTKSRVTILVTEREYEKGKDVFSAENGRELAFESAPENETRLSNMIQEKGTLGVILGTAHYSGPLYLALPKGGIIARFGVGHDGIRKDLAAQYGLYVTNTPAVLDTSVAEHVVCLMCALARNLRTHIADAFSEKWSPNAGMELKDKTLALIGFGRIAKKVAHIAVRGFGMNLIACDMTPYEQHRDFIDGLSGDTSREIRYTINMEQALASAIFISIHLPLTAKTQGLLDRSKLAQISKGAYLINTARGGIVDEIALYDLLATGKLAGAALDVFAREPYTPSAPDKDLRQLPNCLLTPHVASNTDISNRRMAQCCVANIKAHLAGQVRVLDRVT